MKYNRLVALQVLTHMFSLCWSTMYAVVTSVLTPRTIPYSDQKVLLAHTRSVPCMRLSHQCRDVMTRLADGILARIRNNLPDFSEFLRSQKSESLCKAATSGPVFIINVHETPTSTYCTQKCSSHVLS